MDQALQLVVQNLRIKHEQENGHAFYLFYSSYWGSYDMLFSHTDADRVHNWKMVSVSSWTATTTETINPCIEIWRSWWWWIKYRTSACIFVYLVDYETSSPLTCISQLVHWYIHVCKLNVTRIYEGIHYFSVEDLYLHMIDKFYIFLWDILCKVFILMNIIFFSIWIPWLHDVKWLWFEQNQFIVWWRCCLFVNWKGNKRC